jgi:hypothetical protein
MRPGAAFIVHASHSDGTFSDAEEEEGKVAVNGVSSSVKSDLEDSDIK